MRCRPETIRINHTPYYKLTAAAVLLGKENTQARLSTVAEAAGIEPAGGTHLTPLIGVKVRRLTAWRRLYMKASVIY